MIDKKEDNYYVRASAALALAGLGAVAGEHRDVISTLLAHLNDKNDDTYVRRGAVLALGGLGAGAAENPNVIPTLLERWNDMEDDKNVRYYAQTPLKKCSYGYLKKKTGN